MAVGLSNFALVKYLVQQVMLTKKERVSSLTDFTSIPAIEVQCKA